MQICHTFSEQEHININSNKTIVPTKWVKKKIATTEKLGYARNMEAEIFAYRKSTYGLNKEWMQWLLTYNVLILIALHSPCVYILHEVLLTVLTFPFFSDVAAYS